MFRTVPMFIVCAVVCGCSTTPVMTPEQLASSLKRERESLPQVVSISASKDAIIGEWRGSQIVLTQLLDSPDWLDRKIQSDTYQFFADGKYCRLHEGYAATQIMSQGLWSYANGLLSLQVYKNGVFQRLPPFRVIWHEGMLMELRLAQIQDIEIEFAKHFPGKINSHVAKYDADGWLLQTYDLFYISSVRQNSATSPLLLSRLGDATPPPGGVVFKEPIVDDKVLKESLAAHEKYADSMLRVSESAMHAAATMATLNNASPIMPISENSSVAPSGGLEKSGQQNDSQNAGGNSTVKKLNTKRQCNICGTYYDIRALGCPYCKAPKFGFGATSKCARCGFTHFTGGKCPSLDR